MNVDSVTLGRVWAYETGQLKPEEVIALFKDLFDSGELWNLPTIYLTHAGEMFTRGYFDKPKGTN